MKIYHCVAILIAISSPAFSGEFNHPSAESTGSNWGGFYAGIQYSGGKAKYSGTTKSGVSGSIGSNFHGAGVHAGYIKDFGKYTVGGEFDYNRHTLDKDKSAKLDMARLKARAGYDMGSFMPYAALGVARTTGSTGDIGHFIGAGVDIKITENFIFGAEYTKNKIGLSHPHFKKSELNADVVQIRGSYKF